MAVSGKVITNGRFEVDVRGDPPFQDANAMDDNARYMGVDFLAEIEPAALRERVREAVYRACSEVIATDPLLAPAAHLHLGLISLARGDEDAAVEDFQAAVASQDGEVVYKAATQLLGMGQQLAPWEYDDTPLRRALTLAEARAVIGLRGGRKSHYTAEIRDWARASGTLLFTTHPYAIVAWLHSRPGHMLALPALERFYAAAAAELGNPNPIPQAQQLLGLAPASVPRAEQIT